MSVVGASTSSTYGLPGVRAMLEPKSKSARKKDATPAILVYDGLDAVPRIVP
jgi:hypothetical protein